jgi:hypothetical protein
MPCNDFIFGIDCQHISNKEGELFETFSRGVLVGSKIGM